MAKIMAVNAGSSSLKFQLLDMPKESVITSGVFERIGLEEGCFTIKYGNSSEEIKTPIKNHLQAVQMLLQVLVEKQIVKDLNEINAVGHRMVHGGEEYRDSVVVSDNIVNKVKEFNELAPLHNPANLTGLAAFQEALPNVENVFVFDTAFHSTMNEENYIYALPYEYYTQHQIRKYGFHGISHKYVSQVANDMLGNPEHSKIIVCHLGNGASISAIKDGKCIDTSMGFTPLDGLMMGTRCGEVDPSIMPFLAKKLNITTDEVLNIYNKQSGMLGVSGISSDARDIERAHKDGDDRAILTTKLYINNIVKHFGQYYAELGGCDALVFTAGVGENSIFVRELLVKALEEAYDVRLNKEVNNLRTKDNRVISTEDSKMKVMVIPTNEEVMIARDTVRLLNL